MSFGTAPTLGVGERAAQAGRVALGQVLVGLAALGWETGYRNDPLKGSMAEEDGNYSHQVGRTPGCIEVPVGVVGNTAGGVLVEDSLAGDTLAGDNPAEGSLVADTLAVGNPAQEDTLVEHSQAVAVGNLAGDILVEDSLVAGHGSGEDYRSEDVPF